MEIQLRVFRLGGFLCDMFVPGEVLTEGCSKMFGPRREKTCLRGCANNKGADQPAPLCSLISTFVIRFLESILSRFAWSEISIF